MHQPTVEDIVTLGELLKDVPTIDIDTETHAAALLRNTETGKPLSSEEAAKVEEAYRTAAAKPLSPSERRMRERRVGRVLAGPDNSAPREVQRGFQARAVEDSGYVTREGEAWARRVVPKLNKRDRKAEKKRRRYSAEGKRIL